MMFLRDAVLRVLSQTHGFWMLEITILQQVNLTLRPSTAPTELAAALEKLLAKGKVDYQIDEDDQQIRRWQITEVGLQQLR